MWLQIPLALFLLLTLSTSAHPLDPKPDPTPTDIDTVKNDFDAAPPPMISPFLRMLTMGMDDPPPPADIFLPKVAEGYPPWGEEEQSPVLPIMHQLFGNHFDHLLQDGQQPEVGGDMLQGKTVYYMKVGPVQPQSTDKFSVIAGNIGGGGQGPQGVDMTTTDTLKDTEVNKVEPQRAAPLDKYTPTPTDQDIMNEDWTWRQIWMSLLSLCVFAQTLMLIWISKDLEKLRKTRIEKI